MTPQQIQCMTEHLRGMAAAGQRVPPSFDAITAEIFVARTQAYAAAADALPRGVEAVALLREFDAWMTSMWQQPHPDAPPIWRKVRKFLEDAR